MAIREMQKLKKMYPAYKDIPDDRLLHHVVKKYPVYAPIANREFGTVKETKGPRTALMEPAKKVAKVIRKVAAPAVTLPLKGVEALGEIDRVFGAVRSVASGKSPVEGFMKPEETQDFGTSALRAMESYGLAKADDPVQAGWITASAGIALDLGVMHLVFNTLPKVVKGINTNIKMRYTGAQSKALKSFEDAMFREFEMTGIDKINSREAAKAATRSTFRKAPKTDPKSIYRASAFIRVNEGRLANIMKRAAASADVNAKAQGFAKDWVRKATDVSVKKIGMGPQTVLGKQMAEQMPKTQAAIAAVPLHPAAEGREALARIHGMLKGKPSVISKIEKAPAPTESEMRSVVEKAGGKWKGIMGGAPEVGIEDTVMFDEPSGSTLAIPKSQLSEATVKAKLEGFKVKGPLKSKIAPELKQVLEPKAPTPPSKVTPVTKYSPESKYHVEYQSAAGPRKTLMYGAQINDIEGKINANQIPTDPSGIPIIKIIDTFGVNKQSGFADMTVFDDAMTDLLGEAEKAGSKLRHMSKMIGTPFFIGQKYPAFKPIYSAVQNAVDYKAELFFESQHILQPEKLMKLPKVSQEKVAGVIQLGNTPEIQRWYNPEELERDFAMNPQEIESYTRIKRMYNMATQMEIKARKLLMDFDQMDEGAKAIASEALNKQVAKLGGYVSQTRLGGQWAVYSPPDVEGEIAKFFNLYRTKSEAVKASKLIPGSTVYLRDEALKRGIHKNLTVADLENLIESSDAKGFSTDIQALRDELRKRSSSAHWIHRKNVPGYDWTWNNIVESAMDYSEGSSNKLSKVTGRVGSDKAFRENVKGLTPELRAYARDFIDLFYNTGSIGYSGINKLMYGYKLAFKTSWLAVNLVQPLGTTFPLGAKYFPGLENEKVFMKSYQMAWRYFFNRWKGRHHGLPDELLGLVNKMHRQGALGDQMTRFQLGVRGLSKEKFESWLGLYGRIGEGINRTHAAIEGYFAAEKVGITGKNEKLAFMKEFVNKTQFAYGKHNLPQAITSAGSARNLARTAYTFRHFTVSQLQLLNSFMPWRGGTAKQTMTALGVMTAQAGVKGLPFMALVALGYALIRGRTMEHDIRAKAEEYSIPQKAVDVALGGAYNLVGIDASMLIGIGDVIPTFGGVAQAVIGAPAGLAQQLYKAGVFASRGEYARALENASPDAIRNLLRARRYAVEGIRKMSGELIATPTLLDIALRAFGLTPATETRAYAAQEAKAVMRRHGTDKSSDFHRRIARAIFDKDRVGRREVIAEMRAYNKKVPRENRVRLSEISIRSWIDKFRGMKDRRAPRKLKREFRRIDKLYKAR